MRASSDAFVQYLIKGKQLKEGAAFLYGLADPISDEIRYIGITKHPIARYRQHCTEAGGFKKGAWVRSVFRKTGMYPYPVVLAVCDESQAGSMERHAIKTLRAQGARLTNLSDGGGSPSQRGRKFSDAHRARLSKNKRDYYASLTPAAKSQRASHAAKLGWERHREKIIAAQNVGKAIDPNRTAKYEKIRLANTGQKRTGQALINLTKANQTPEKREKSRQGGIKGAQKRWHSQSNKEY